MVQRVYYEACWLRDLVTNGNQTTHQLQFHDATTGGIWGN